MTKPRTRQPRVAVATPVDLGALVREARERRGWTQTDLGARIGASRFWVAEFERGKAGAELGLSLQAVAAVGVRLKAERPVVATPVATADGPDRTAAAPPRDPRLGTVACVHRPGPPTVEAVALDDIVGATPGFIAYRTSNAAPSRSAPAGSRRGMQSTAGVVTTSKAPRKTTATRPAARAAGGRTTTRRAPQGG